MMDINKMAKNYTREDFLNKVQGMCPKSFGLTEFQNGSNECKRFDDCSDCRKYAIKDIQFKGEEDEIKEESKDNKWIFNLEDFKNENIAIHCKTKEEADQLFDVFFNNGVQIWSDGDAINRLKIYYIDYKEYTCYEFDESYGAGIALGEIGYYEEEEYEIFEFSGIYFSQVYNKQSIDKVALNNTNEEELLTLKCIDNDDNDLNLTIGNQYKMYDKDNCGYLVIDDVGSKSWYSKIRFELYDKQNSFDITKVKYITKEQLQQRGYKTGDTLFDGTSMAIVYGNKVLHINDNCVETLDIRAFDYILPIELIESDSEIQRLLSGKLSGKTSQAYIIDYFIKIEEPPKLKTICSVKFTAETDTTKDFILEDDNEFKIGDVIECCTGSAYQYGRIIDISNKELSEHEINTYRKCRKLSE